MGLQQTWAKILGVILVIVGVLGFFTGDMVFGFAVNGLHNIVHLVTGLLALYFGFSNGGRGAQSFNKIFGVIYLLVAILGLLNLAFIVDLLALNGADNWLHVVIGLVTAGIGFFA